MKKRLKLITVGAFIVTMVFMLFGCSNGSGDFEGKLINMNQDTLVLKAGQDVEIFSTNDDTDYDLGDEDEITAGDTLFVEYHSKGKQMIADKVTIVKAVSHTSTMTGELSDLNDGDFIVSSDSLSVKFTYDEDTDIKGDLNEGDEVKVTYKGSLSEEPYAVKVDILEEQKDDPHYEAHGIVADVSDVSVLLSMDSAEAHRFLINGDTEIVSTDKKIEIGDRAEITFTGDIDNDPVATKIIIHHQEKDDESVINGTLENAEKTSFELNTGKNTYKILVDDKTKFTGDKYQSGAKATVSYKGKLGEEPLATKVYCGKKKEDPTKTTTKATTKATTKKTTKKTTEKPTETKTKTETKTETKTKPPVPPKPVIVTVDGDIEVWDGEKMTCTIKIDEENSVDLNSIDQADIPIGYFPEVGDHVRVMYDKDTMELKEMQLLSRPDPDPETPPDRDEGGKQETQPAETEAPETTPAANEKKDNNEGNSGNGGNEANKDNGDNQNAGDENNDGGSDDKVEADDADSPEENDQSNGDK